jgi:hypothetical protein
VTGGTVVPAIAATPLQTAIRELEMVMNGARNVLSAAEYDIYVAVAIATVARHAAAFVDQNWLEGAA